MKKTVLENNKNPLPNPPHVPQSARPSARPPACQKKGETKKVPDVRIFAPIHPCTHTPAYHTLIHPSIIVPVSDFRLDKNKVLPPAPICLIPNIYDDSSPQTNKLNIGTYFSSSSSSSPSSSSSTSHPSSSSVSSSHSSSSHSLLIGTDPSIFSTPGLNLSKRGPAP